MTLTTDLEEGEVEQHEFGGEVRFTFTQDQLIEEAHAEIPVTEKIQSNTPRNTCHRK